MHTLWNIQQLPPIGRLRSYSRMVAPSAPPSINHQSICAARRGGAARVCVRTYAHARVSSPGVARHCSSVPWPLLAHIRHSHTWISPFKYVKWSADFLTLSVFPIIVCTLIVSFIFNFHNKISKNEIIEFTLNITSLWNRRSFPSWSPLHIL